jgi:hypothetical protein
MYGSISQGLKPSLVAVLNAKAKALAYLRSKGNCNDKSNRRSFDSSGKERRFRSG